MADTTASDARPAPADGPEAIETRLREIVAALEAQKRSRDELDQAKARIAELEHHATETRARRTATPPPEMTRHSSRPDTSENPAPPSTKTPWTRLPSRAGTLPPIGQTLLSRGFITEEDLERALGRQRESGRRLGETLVELGALSSYDLASVLADQLGVPFIDLRSHPPDPLLTTLIPEDVARRYCALPIARWAGQLVIATTTPNDVFALDDLRVRTRESIIPAMADGVQLVAAIDAAYRASDIETTLDDASNDFAHEATRDESADVKVDEGPVVRLVAALLEEAVERGASDLHIEPSSTGVALRFRIDGVLHDSSEAQLSVLRPLVSRLKVLGGLDISQSRLPQDGRFSVPVGRNRIDVRVATVPTAGGEAVVLRLLDPRRGVMDLGALRLTSEELARFEPAFRSPQGAVFVCGPTGSGKTSTLYAVLNEISTRDRSIVSVEDPIEYRFDGIKQIQINARAGLTFPVALRSILRTDPDVILIGEVRDTETAQIAIDASSTGHVVFSTLHTTRAAATPLRLIDMGIEPYLVASALTCVVAQRLARQLCEDCAEPDPETDAQLLRRLGASEELLTDSTIRRAVGCASCRGTGYKGRRPIYEIMPMTEALERLLLAGCSASQLEQAAIGEGMRTLRASGLALVAAGEMTVAELLRITA